MGISNLTEKRVKNVKESAVSDHHLQCDCIISFDDFEVLASETNNFRLLIKESVTALNRGTSIYLTNLLGMFDF